MFRTKKANTEPVELTVSNRTVVRVLLLVVISTIALASLRQASHALVLIFTASFLALAFNGPVAWVARKLPGKKRGNRTWATVLASLFVLLLLGSFVASIVPPIIKQSSTFIDNAPQLVYDMRNSNTPLGGFVERYNLQSQVDSLSNELRDRLQNASGKAVSTISQVGSSLFSLLTVTALTFMMLIEGPHWIGWAKRIIPRKRRDDADKLITDMYAVVKGYVNGQVTLALVAALLILPMFFLLHIPYPFALVFVVFVCGLIPMIGHTIGAAIVTLVALTYSFGAALLILSYYILYQQIENYVVQPKIQANSTNMSPLLVFVSVVVGVSFGGLLGGLVAIPIMGCIRVGILHWLESRDITGPGPNPSITTT